MRKNTLAAFSFLLLTSVSYSQFNKGSLLLGADLGFNTQKSTTGNLEYKSNGFYFSPTVAVATKQNTFWGGFLNTGFSKSTSENPVNLQKNNNYGAGLFFRKYKPVLGKWYAFVQAGVSATIGKYNTESGPDSYSESKSFSTGLNITPGISVAVSKKVYLEGGFSNIAAVNYQHSTGSSYNFGNTSKSESSGFGFSSSLGSFTNNLYFGFRFIIPKGS
jgi:hypothetical protein